MPDVSLIGVYDRGVPNQERILIQANQNVQMASYGVLIGQSTGAASAVPYRDNFFWFGEGLVEAGAYVFVYTGPGEYRRTSMPNGAPAHVFHWGKETTVFANSSVVPVLIRVDMAQVGLSPANTPQNKIEQIPS